MNRSAKPARPAFPAIFAILKIDVTHIDTGVQTQKIAFAGSSERRPHLRLA
jgi:hypothetical protein